MRNEQRCGAINRGCRGTSCCGHSRGAAGGEGSTDGILAPGSSAFPTLAYHDSFRQGLRELGYIEGKNIFIEIRYAEGKRDRLSDIATELVKLKVDLIVTATRPGVLAAKSATSAIPIVFAAVGDPVRAGLVSSLARPGGNITGLSIIETELFGKRLELLKETLPKITKVAHFRDATSPGTGSAEMQATASALGLQLQSLEVRSAKDFDGAFEAILKDAPSSLQRPVPSSALINSGSWPSRRRIGCQLSIHTARVSTRVV